MLWLELLICAIFAAMAHAENATTAVVILSGSQSEPVPFPFIIGIIGVAVVIIIIVVVGLAVWWRKKNTSKSLTIAKRSSASGSKLILSSEVGTPSQPMINQQLRLSQTYPVPQQKPLSLYGGYQSPVQSNQQLLDYQQQQYQQQQSHNHVYHNSSPDYMSPQSPQKPLTVGQLSASLRRNQFAPSSSQPLPKADGSRVGGQRDYASTPVYSVNRPPVQMQHLYSVDNSSAHSTLSMQSVAASIQQQRYAGSTTQTQTEVPTMFDSTIATVVPTAVNNMTISNTTTQAGDLELSIPGFLEIKSAADYRLGQKIASGGEATIYMAEVLSAELVRRIDGERVVVKMLKDVKSSAQEKQELAFSQEVAVLWFFRNYANFAKIFGFSFDPKIMILKYYSFGNLRALTIGKKAAKVPYSKRLIVSILNDISTALSAMHSNGFVHSDIKPQNILLEKSPVKVLNAVLSDFGITQIVEGSALLVKEFKVANVKGASIAFTAPEILRAMKERIQEPMAPQTCKAADIYSLAIVICEVVSRRQPWKPRQ